MSSIRYLHRRLGEAIPPHSASEMIVRNCLAENDIEQWLDVRNQAAATLQPSARSWGMDDMRRQILVKLWSNPRNIWLALRYMDGKQPEPLGAVVLALRTKGKSTIPWLAVVPRARGMGVASLLMDHAEARCVENGVFDLYLETHSSWHEANRFYSRRGYQSCLATIVRPPGE